MTHLLYSDIFNRHPTLSNLYDFVCTIDWHDVVAKCSGIALLSWENGIEDPSHQASLIENLLQHVPSYNAKVRAFLTNEPHRRLFSRETLLAMLRIATVQQQAREAISERAFADAFLRAALAANEFISDELMPEKETRTGADVLATELRSHVVQIENPHVQLARTDAFFAWSRTSAATSSINYLDIEGDLLRFTGLTPIEYAAGAYTLLARTVNVHTVDELMKVGVVFTPDRWLAGLPDTRVPLRWLEISSIPIETIREEWALETSLSFVGVGSLYRKPVIAADGVSFVPTPFLISNAMGDGTYFTLFDGYNDADRLKLSRFYGEFFEDYIAEIFERGFAPRSDAHVYREPPIGDDPNDRGSDVIIDENGDLIFVEVVAKRLNLIGSILRLDPASIERDLRAGVLKKLWQLHRNVEQYKAGALLPNIARIPGQRIFPVLVAPKNWPRIYLIDTLIKEAQRDQSLLAGTEPIELLDMGEVEWLEGDLANGLKLGELLHRKNNSARHNRFNTLTNYLIDVEPKSTTVRNRARDRGDLVARRVYEIASSWVTLCGSQCGD